MSLIERLSRQDGNATSNHEVAVALDSSDGRFAKRVSFGSHDTRRAKTRKSSIEAPCKASP